MYEHVPEEYLRRLQAVAVRAREPIDHELLNARLKQLDDYVLDRRLVETMDHLKHRPLQTPQDDLAPWFEALIDLISRFNDPERYIVSLLTSILDEQTWGTTEVDAHGSRADLFLQTFKTWRQRIALKRRLRKMGISV